MKIWCWWPTYINTYSDPDSTERFPAGTEGQNATMNHIKVKILHLSELHFDPDSLLMVTGSVCKTQRLTRSYSGHTGR